MTNQIRAVLVLTVALGLTVAAATPAGATEYAPTAAPSLATAALEDLPDETIEEAFNDLQESSAPRSVRPSAASDLTLTTFTLPTGSTLTFPTDEVGAYLGGGWDGSHGLYVEFNRVDQAAIASGGGAALATALCLIPGVGAALCVVAVAVVGAATAAIAAHGMCSNIMRIYAQLLGYPECR